LIRPLKSSKKNTLRKGGGDTSGLAGPTNTERLLRKMRREIFRLSAVVGGAGKVSPALKQVIGTIQDDDKI